MTLTKICGLSTPQTLDAAIGGGASHVGFVHFGKSPRHVSFDQIGQLLTLASGSAVKTVVLLVDPDFDVLSRFSALQPDIIQLHGAETPGDIAAMKQRFPFEYWKAVPVRSADDFARARAYAGTADRVLFDAPAPEGGVLPGGNGVRLDWSILQSHRSARDWPGLDWGLAGGLDASNVAQAVRETGAPLVDVSSGVESAPGIKDVDKIAAFLREASSL